MGRMNILIKARKVSVIFLTTLGLVVLVSGMILDTAPSGPGSSDMVALGLTKSLWEDIHIYASFALAGAAIVHAYTNYRGILYHLGILGLLKRMKSK